HDDRRTALGRVGLSEDIGPAIAALLSDANRWVNAQRIEASGGILVIRAMLQSKNMKAALRRSPGNASARLLP
ncbi:MAG: hypothetical protein AAAB11_07155, partial [Rhizobium giardinii]